MDPHTQWCHNRRCRAYGRTGEGHIVIHSRKERRYQSKRCRRTFSARRDTALYRMHKPEWLVLAVATLLAYGCPVQAIVAAFDLDERTVARWQREAGLQCKRLHEHLVEAGRVQLLQVQADEIRVKAVGGIYWLASALEVRSRLWLGSVINQYRNRFLIQSLLIRVRSCGPVEGILLVTDGLSSYASQALHVFREPLSTGKVGRPRLVLARGVMIAQVIKRHERRRVVEVLRRIVVGTEAEPQLPTGPRRSAYGRQHRDDREPACPACEVAHLLLLLRSNVTTSRLAGCYHSIGVRQVGPGT